MLIDISTRTGSSRGAPDPVSVDAVVISGLHVRRGGRTVLHDVSLRVRRGSVTGLLGPSGCGKSTLIRAIMGVQILAGRLRDGPWCSRRVDRLALEVGYVTQPPAPYDDLTVRENLAYFGRIVSAAPSRVDEVLATVDLERVQPQAPASCPGGSGPGCPWPRPFSANPTCWCWTARPARSVGSRVLGPIRLVRTAADAVWWSCRSPRASESEETGCRRSPSLLSGTGAVPRTEPPETSMTALSDWPQAESRHVDLDGRRFTTWTSEVPRERRCSCVSMVWVARP